MNEQIKLETDAMIKMHTEIHNQTKQTKKPFSAIEYYNYIKERIRQFGGIIDSTSIIGGHPIFIWYNIYKEQYIMIKLNDELIEKANKRKTKKNYLSIANYYNEVGKIFKRKVDDNTIIGDYLVRAWYSKYLDSLYLVKIRPPAYNIEEDKNKYRTGYKNSATNEYIFRNQNLIYHRDYSGKLPKKLPKIHYFPYKNNKKYQLKYIGSLNEYQMDLFYSGKYCYLLAIEIETRYLTCALTNITLQNGKIEQKSLPAILNALRSMYETQLFYPKIIHCDSEPAIFSDFLKNVLWEVNQVKVYPVERIKIGRISYPIHSSLAIIDRVCRTIRDMADNLGLDEIDPEHMFKIVWNYNHAPHRTLSEIIGKIVSPIEVKLNRISYNIDYHTKLIEENAKIIGQEGFQLKPGTKVVIYNTHNTLKKRNKILPDKYIVEDFIHNKYIVHKEKNPEEKMAIPRFLLNPVVY